MIPKRCASSPIVPWQCHQFPESRFSLLFTPISPEPMRGRVETAAACGGLWRAGAQPAPCPSGCVRTALARAPLCPRLVLGTCHPPPRRRPSRPSCPITALRKLDRGCPRRLSGHLASSLHWGVTPPLPPGVYGSGTQLCALPALCRCRLGLPPLSPFPCAPASSWDTGDRVLEGLRSGRAASCARLFQGWERWHWMPSFPSAPRCYGRVQAGGKGAQNAPRGPEERLGAWGAVVLGEGL